MTINKFVKNWYIIQSMKYTVVTFYSFFKLSKLNEMKTKLLGFCKRNGLLGTIILSQEGVNSTVSGSAHAIERLIEFFQQKNIPINNYKYSKNSKQPFLRMKVKIKSELISLGVEDLDLDLSAGTHVNPKSWQSLLNDPETIVVDTRNSYETMTGKFEHAIDPNIDNFKQFPEFVEQELSAHKNKKIAIYCTGGIRCEKAAAYLKQKDFTEVYQLEGGILNYLENHKDDSKWQGDCFVFDERVTVDHELRSTNHTQCHGCRLPLTKKQLESEHYIPGVQCEYCYDQRSADSLNRSLQRQKQITLAKTRGESHLGDKTQN